MERNVCPICGSNLEFDARAHRYTCRFCGYSKAEEATAEETALLYAAAQRLRLADFDQAHELYADIVHRFPRCAEAYWGMALSDYGIKYEDDCNGKKIPTCYAARYECLYDSDNYKKAVSCGDAEQRAYYEAQAALIERIRIEWVAKAEKEPPYDVFLSFKDTDGDQRTPDSYDASEIYHVLTDAGYRVFFSRITLQGKTGENFEPYIFAALNSARVMLVFASKVEYIEATWVRNEWNRYLARIKSKQKAEGSLCVIFKDLNPATLPAVLRNKQHLKYGELTFVDTLRAYVEKHVSAGRQNVATIERKEVALAKKKGQKSIDAVKIETATSIERKKSAATKQDVQRRQIGEYEVPVLSQSEEGALTEAEIYLSRGDYVRAKPIYEQVLSSSPNSSEALLGILLCKTEKRSFEEWLEQGITDLSHIKDALDLVGRGKKETALAILDGYAALCLKYAKNEQFGQAKTIYEAVAGYEVPSIEALHRQLFDAIAPFVSSDEVLSFVRLILPYLSQNKELYQASLLSLARQCIKRQRFPEAEHFCAEYTEYFDLDVDTFLLSLEAKYKVGDEFTLFSRILSSGDFSVFSGGLPLNQEQIDDLFGRFSDHILSHIDKEPVSTNAGARFLLPYRFAKREEFIEKGIDICCANPDEKVAKVLDGFLHAFGNEDFDRYVGTQRKFVDACMEKRQFALAVHYLDRLIEHDPDEPSHHQARILALCGCENENLGERIHALEDFSDIQSLLSLRKSKETFPTLKPYFEACVQSRKTDGAARVFDAISAYVQSDEDKALMPYVRQMANKCLADSYFDLAARYFSLLIAFNQMDHEAYWGLLQAKLRCCNDQQMEQQERPLADFVEFENAKKAAMGQRDVLTHYIEVEANQIRWDERHRKEVADAEAAEKARRKRKNRIRAIAISSIAAVTAIATMTALTFTVIIPSTKVNGARSSILSGDYDAAIATLEGQGYGESQGLLGMAKAGKSFTEQNYEEAIDYVLNAGGEVRVNYDADGGNSPKASETIKKRARHVDNDPSLLGYTFRGWGQERFAISVENGYSADLWLKASYSIDTYSITYELNGGTNAASNPTTYTVEDEVTLSAPTKRGFTFLGWYDGEGSMVVTIPKGSTGNRALTARWNEGNAYQVSLDPNGGQLNDITINVQFDQPYSLPTPTRKGYEFLGWFDGEENVPSSGVWAYEGNRSIKASWAIIDYSIDYELNGGTNDQSNPASYTVEEEIVLKDPVRIGYTFLGWMDENNAKTTGIPKDSIGNRRFVAQWNDGNSYAISLNPNGGEVPSVSLNAQFDHDYALPAPTRKGYAFLGWYQGEDAFASSGVWKTDHDVQLEAHWEITVYSITYTLNGGTNSANNPAIYTVNDEVVFAAPTRTGYEFQGWVDENNGAVTSIAMGSTGDLTLIAQWNDGNVYHLSLDANEGNVDSDSLDVQFGHEYTLPTPTREGYEFTGWISGEETIPTTGSWSWDGISSLKASWSIEHYTIRYYLDGGINSEDNPATYTIDDAVTLSDPTRDGRVFIEWLDVITDDPVTGIPQGSTGDRSFFAVWSPLILQSSDETLGTASMTSGTGKAGTSVTVTAEPIGTNVFVGWYSGSTLVSKSVSYTFQVPYGDYTLTAKFMTKDEYAAEWNKAHGVVPVYDAINSKITYGLYPQTHVKDQTLIAALDEQGASLGAWVNYEGEYYVRKAASPYYSSVSFSDGTTIVSGTEYWFLCEPITWKILKQSSGTYFVCSEKLLDYQAWRSFSGNYGPSDSNVYSASDVRTFLLNTFSNNAFRFGSSYLVSSGIISFSDSVFLLSKDELSSSTYGFSSASSRQCSWTDYAVSQYFYDTTYWTRTGGTSDTAYEVWGTNGFDNVNVRAKKGIRAATRIKIA